jgi:hypothetical protein
MYSVISISGLLFIMKIFSTGSYTRFNKHKQNGIDHMKVVKNFFLCFDKEWCSWKWRLFLIRIETKKYFLCLIIILIRYNLLWLYSIFTRLIAFKNRFFIFFLFSITYMFFFIVRNIMKIIIGSLWIEEQ